MIQLTRLDEKMENGFPTEIKLVRKFYFEVLANEKSTIE